jgi:hypothetical protein
VSVDKDGLDADGRYGSGTANQAPVAPADATGRLMGYAVRETTGTAGATAQVKFRSRHDRRRHSARLRRHARRERERPRVVRPGGHHRPDRCLPRARLGVD